MELLRFLAAIILTGLCAYFIFAVMADFKYRQCMTHAWLQLVFGATISILCGAGAYHLY